MPPNKQRQTLQSLADKYAGCYTFGEASVIDAEHFCSTIDIPLSDNADVPVPEIEANHLCAIVFTSGSTGTPTPNNKYWETLRVGALSDIELLMQDDVVQTSLLATVPAQHMWGLGTSILFPLFCDMAVSHHTPFFPQDIADALAALPEPRALVSLPVHLDAFLRANVGRLKIDQIFSATAPMSADMARELEQRFSARVIEIFGCSEAGIIARRYTASETAWQLSTMFSVDVNAERVLIQAPHLPEDVILHDIIELVGDGQFRWLGRHQDMVNIAGKRGSLADLNHRLNEIPGVVDGVIFMPDENSGRLAALVVAPDLQPSDILEKLKPGIDPAFLPRPLYKVPMLPRQETGKLARKIIVELFEKMRRAKAQQDDEPPSNQTQ